MPASPPAPPGGELLVHDTTVVTGDGVSLDERVDIVIRDGLIREMHPSRPRAGYERIPAVIDGRGLLLMPGLINNHTHGTAYGPLFPSGHTELERGQVLANLDRHLLQGTTTVLCVDGFVTADQIAETNNDHPLTVRLASCNTPACLQAAQIADGGGLRQPNREFTARQAASAGAVALGEIGAGHTLGGGGASYMYIPERVRERTGVTITAGQANRLKYAVLGRHIDVSAFDGGALETALAEAGLTGLLSPGEASDIVSTVVLPAFDIALEGLTEAAAIAERIGIPVLVHNAAASMTQVRKIAQTDVRLIAGHSNHSSFELGEALEHAEKLKSLGATIDVSTLDTFGARRMISGPELLFAMLGDGLVDTISTDYAGGHHDPILTAIDAATKAGVVSVPAAVAMATANVAEAIAGIAPNRGRVAEGAVADLVLVRRDQVDDVRVVLLGGTVAVSDAARVVA